MYYRLSIDLSKFNYTYGQIFDFVETPSKYFDRFEEYLTEGPDYDANPCNPKPINPWEDTPNARCTELNLWVFSPKDNPRDTLAFVCRAQTALLMDFVEWIESDIVHKTLHINPKV